jgi:Flp pilus assembly protein TadG
MLAVRRRQRGVPGFGQPSCALWHRRGQSLTELAMAIPVMVLMLMGGFDASIMVSDKVTSGSAVRQGARLAAELGGSRTNPDATTTDIDMQIVRNVLAMAQGMTSATVQEIDIYTPSNRDGSYQLGLDPVDQYLIGADGAVTPGTQTFPIANRNQTPPSETSIGVRLVWQYNAPAGIFPKNIPLSDYAVMKAAPILL